MKIDSEMKFILVFILIIGSVTAVHEYLSQRDDYLKFQNTPTVTSTGILSGEKHRLDLITAVEKSCEKAESLSECWPYTIDEYENDYDPRVQDNLFGNLEFVEFSISREIKDGSGILLLSQTCKVNSLDECELYNLKHRMLELTSNNHAKAEVLRKSTEVKSEIEYLKTITQL